MPTALEKMRAKRESMKSGDNTDLAKIPAGKSKWRVMPCWRKEGTETRPLGEYALAFKQHWIKHPTQEREDSPGQKKILAVLNSVKEAYDEPCQVGELITHGLMNETDPAIKASLEEARGSTKWLMNLMRLDGSSAGEVVQVAVPVSIADVIFGIAEQDEEYLSGEKVDSIVTDPMQGVVFEFSREGAMKNTKYAATAVTKGVSLDTRPITPDEMALVKDLDEIVTPNPKDAARALEAMNVVMNPHGGTRSNVLEHQSAVAAPQISHMSEKPADNEFEGAVNVQELGAQEGVDPIDELLKQQQAS